MADKDNNFNGRYPWYKRVMEDHYIQDMNDDGELLWIPNANINKTYQYNGNVYPATRTPKTSFAEVIITDTEYQNLSDTKRKDYDPLWYVAYDKENTRIYPNTVRLYPNKEAAKAAGWNIDGTEGTEYAAEMDGIDFFKDNKDFQWVLFCADTEQNRKINDVERAEINVPRFSFKGSSIDTVRYQKSFMKTHSIGTKLSNPNLVKSRVDPIIGVLDEYCFENTSMQNFHFRSPSQTRSIKLQKGTFKGVSTMNELYIHAPNSEQLYLGTDIIFRETPPRVQTMDRIYLATKKIYYVTCYAGTHGLPFNFDDMTPNKNSLNTFEYYTEAVEVEKQEHWFWGPNNCFFLGLGGGITVCKTNYPSDLMLSTCDVVSATGKDIRNSVCDLLWVIVDDNDINIGENSNFTNRENTLYGWYVPTSAIYFERRGRGKVYFSGAIDAERHHHILYMYLDNLTHWFDNNKFTVADGLETLLLQDYQKIQLIPCAWDPVNTNLTWKQLSIANKELLDVKAKTTQVSATVTTVSFTNQITDGSTISSMSKKLVNSWSVNSIVVDTMLDMPQECFKDCSMKSIVISNLSVITERAFENCTNLSTVKIGVQEKTLPTGFTSGVFVDQINDDAFAKCSSLTSMFVSVNEKIGSRVFNECTKLGTIYLKSKSIGSNVLQKCTALTGVYWDYPEWTSESFATNAEENYGLMPYAGDSTRGWSLYISNKTKKIPKRFLTGSWFSDTKHLPAKIVTLNFFELTNDGEIILNTTNNDLEVIGEMSFKNVVFDNIQLNFRTKTPKIKSFEESCFNNTGLTLMGNKLILPDTIERIEEKAFNNVFISAVNVYNSEGDQVIPQQLHHVAPGAFGNPLPTWGYSADYCDDARPDMFYRVDPDYSKIAANFNYIPYSQGLVHENFTSSLYGDFNFPILLLRINPGATIETYWQLCVFCPYIWDGNGTNTSGVQCFIAVNPTLGGESDNDTVVEDVVKYAYPIYYVSWSETAKKYSVNKEYLTGVKMALSDDSYPGTMGGVGAAIQYQPNMNYEFNYFFYIRNDPFLMSSQLPSEEPEDRRVYWEQIQGFSPYSFSHLWFFKENSQAVFKFGKQARVLDEHAFYHTWFCTIDYNSLYPRWKMDQQLIFNFNQIRYFGRALFPYTQMYTSWKPEGSNGESAQDFQNHGVFVYKGHNLSGIRFIFETPIVSRYTSSFSNSAGEGRSPLEIDCKSSEILKSWCFNSQGQQTNLLDSEYVYTTYRLYNNGCQVKRLRLGTFQETGENRADTWDWTQNAELDCYMFEPFNVEKKYNILTNHCLDGLTGLTQLYINLTNFTLPETSVFDLYVDPDDALKLAVHTIETTGPDNIALFGNMGNQHDQELAGITELILPTWGIGNSAWGHTLYSEVPNIEYFEIYNPIEGNTFEGFQAVNKANTQFTLLRLGAQKLHTLIIPLIGTSINDQCSLYTSLFLCWIWPSSMTEDEDLAALINHLNFPRLKKIKITNVKLIPDNCFYRLTALEDLTIVNATYDRIGNSAFEDCNKLPYLKAPKTLTSIDAKAFKNCKAFQSLDYVGTKDEWYKNITFADKNSSPFGDTEVAVGSRKFNKSTYLQLTDLKKEGYYNDTEHYVSYDENAFYGFPIYSLTFDEELRALNTDRPVLLEKPGLEFLAQLSFNHLRNDEYSLKDHVFINNVKYPNLRAIYLGSEITKVPNRMFQNVQINTEFPNSRGWIIVSLTENIKELGENSFDNAYVAIRKTKDKTTIMEEGKVKDDITVWSSAANMAVPSSTYFEKLKFANLQLSNNAGILLKLPANDDQCKLFVNNIMHSLHGVYYYDNGQYNYCTGCIAQEQNDVSIPDTQLKVVDLHSFRAHKYQSFTIPWILPHDIEHAYALTEMVSLDSWIDKDINQIQIVALTINNHTNDIYYNPSQIESNSYGREMPNDAVTIEDKKKYAFGQQPITKKAVISNSIVITVPNIKGTVSHTAHFPSLANQKVDYVITIKECPGWLLSDNDTMEINTLTLNSYQQECLVLHTNSLCAPVINNIYLKLNHAEDNYRLKIYNNAFMLGGMDTGMYSILVNHNIYVNCSLAEWIKYIYFEGILSNPIRASRRFYTNGKLEHICCPFGEYDANNPDKYYCYINSHSLDGNYLLNELDLIPRKTDDKGNIVKDDSFNGDIVITQCPTKLTSGGYLENCEGLIEIYSGTSGVSFYSDVYRALFFKPNKQESSNLQTDGLGKEVTKNE